MDSTPQNGHTGKTNTKRVRAFPLWTLLIIVSVLAAVGCAREHENVVHVIAEQAPGLKKSARVQFRGVDVGLGKQVYYTPGGVRIDLVIDRNDVPIRTQDTVRNSSVAKPFDNPTIYTLNLFVFGAFSAMSVHTAAPVVSSTGWTFSDSVAT